MKTKINLKRRSFLQNLAMFTAGSSMFSSYGKLQLIQSAFAAPEDYASLTDHKSLVCVFLPGGNDALNTFIPNTDPEYQHYADVRQSMTINRAALHLINGGSHGFHPALTNLRDLYDSNKLAVIANTGNLFEPISRTEFFDHTDNNASLNVPPNLFAHDKQQEIWHTGLAPAAGIIYPGWGGRLADLLSTANTNPNVPPAFTIAGNNPWQASVNELNHSYSIEARTPISIGTFEAFNGQADVYADPRRPVRSAAWKAILDLPRTDPLQAHAANAFLDTRLRANLLRNKLQQNAISFQTPLPGANSLATQLRAVAEMISIREELGLKRQTFFVALSSWDTHKDQLEEHSRLLTLLNDALFSFQNTLEELGAEDSVTTFTASEFGRTLTSNGTGTDHAWATDYMVMGGAVDGGKIHGEVIEYSSTAEGIHRQEKLFGSQDVGSGRFIPKYSTDQYGATLAKWMGVTDNDLLNIYPNLGNFTVRDLGFMQS